MNESMVSYRDNATDEIITDTVIDNGASTEDENDHLNYSSEIVNELHQTKRTTIATKKRRPKIFHQTTRWRRQQPPKSLKKLSAEEKKILNTAVIEAIIKDALPFNHFSKPGYRGPYRKIVRKHLVR
ncbi:unnamed protein product [Rotaria sp. Silwood1]|nr:unnamed protein product [Rotaria sp. Silwood1]